MKSHRPELYYTVFSSPIYRPTADIGGAVSIAGASPYYVGDTGDTNDRSDATRADEATKDKLI